MKKALFLGFLLLIPSLLFSQEDSSDHFTPNKFHQFSFIPLPAVASNPANGWMFGFAPSASWYMGNPKTTKLSNLVGNLLYTTKKQWIFSSRHTIYLADNSAMLIGDWRYFLTSQPTYGLGSSTPNELAENPNRYGVYWGEQQMDFTLIRFYEAFLKRIGDSKFDLGLGYHPDIHTRIKSFITETADPNNLFAHDQYNLSRGFNPNRYTLSGVTLNAVMENRDMAVSPYERNFAWMQYKINPTFLGSDQSSSTLLLDYRHYFNLNPQRKRHLIGVWGMGNFLISGDLPYMNLPSIGWDMFGRGGRAYAQGRFRGANMIYGEAEWRFPLQKNKETFGGTVFVNGATFSGGKPLPMIGANYSSEKLFEKINPGYGLGLRVIINKEKRTTIAADYAFGQKGNSGFYLNINETF